MKFNNILIDNHPNHNFETRKIVVFQNIDAQNIKSNESDLTVIIGTVLGYCTYQELFNNKYIHKYIIY